MKLFYGLYRGTVKDNNDPKQLGRCKVKVMPMFDGVSDSDLPWALNRSSRIIDIPEVESIVWVVFEEGDHMSPIYEGLVCDENKNTIPNEAKTNYPTTRVWKIGNHLFEINNTTKDLKYTNGNGAVIEVDGSTGQIKLNGHLTVDK